MARCGRDAVLYALARTASGAAGAIERQLALPLDLSNPFLAVSYAHADAASTLRWATDLELPAFRPAGLDVPSAQPGELAVLDVLSWLPERLAAAARRNRPAELAVHLENLAGAWLDCRERCPGLGLGGRAAGADRTAERLVGQQDSNLRTPVPKTEPLPLLTRKFGLLQFRPHPEMPVCSWVSERKPSARSSCSQ